jgi:O-antigen/teichoic acid export membrane protein
MYTIRLPYLTMILAAGHYKQTQHISFTEAGLNVLISIIVVQLWGLCGVALGTFVSMAFCTVGFACYLRKAILNRPIKYFIKHILVDGLTVLCIVFTTHWGVREVVSYVDWVYMACKIASIGLAEILILNMFFYKHHIAWISNRIMSYIRK